MSPKPIALPDLAGPDEGGGADELLAVLEKPFLLLPEALLLSRVWLLFFAFMADRSFPLSVVDRKPAT